MVIGDSYEFLEMALGSDVECLKLADLPKNLPPAFIEGKLDAVPMEVEDYGDW